MTDLSEDPEGDFIARWSARLGCLGLLVAVLSVAAFATYLHYHPVVKMLEVP